MCSVSAKHRYPLRTELRQRNPLMVGETDISFYNDSVFSLPRIIFLLFTRPLLFVTCSTRTDRELCWPVGRAFSGFLHLYLEHKLGKTSLPFSADEIWALSFLSATRISLYFFLFCFAVVWASNILHQVLFQKVKTLVA